MNEILFDIVDVFGSCVILTKQRWEEHILVSHPEMVGLHEAVRDTIAEPDCVYTSETTEQTKLFYKLGVVAWKFRNLFLKAVVSYDREPAILRTSFFTRQLRGERLLWIKPKP